VICKNGELMTEGGGEYIERVRTGELLRNA
jgi:hypothetical protein